MKQKTIALCLPGQTYSSPWVAAYAQLYSMLQASGWQVINLFSYSSNVYVTRQCLADAVLKANPQPQFVLWLDDDNLLTFEQFQMMLDDLTCPVADAIAAWTWIQPDVHTNPDPTVSCGGLDELGRCDPFTYAQIASAKGLVEVDYTGFPAVLMTHRLLAMVGPQGFTPILNPSHPFGIVGEDTAFCIHAREAGFRLFTDPRLYVPHLKLRAACPPGFDPTTGMPKPVRVLERDLISSPEKGLALVGMGADQ